MANLYFEDLSVGTKLSCGEYEVTKEEIIQFASRWDPQVFHVNEDLARASLYGGVTAAASHTFCIFSLLGHRMPEKMMVMGLLGMEQMRFPNPVRPGDRLSLIAECVERRESRSRPTLGIVTTVAKLVNQHGVTVMEAKSNSMVERLRNPGSGA